MARDNSVSRRTALKVTGTAAATALVAGCSGGGDDSGNGNENGGDEGFEIEPDTTIELEGTTSDWTGVAPDKIADESNPTLILQSGESYELGWTQGDGNGHNIEIRNDSDEVVNELSTDVTDEEEPANQMLEFEASDEMAVYRCQPHAQMEGDIQVE